MLLQEGSCIRGRVGGSASLSPDLAEEGRITGGALSCWAEGLLSVAAPRRGKPDLSGGPMDWGRIHCVTVATRAGEVVFERFYDRLTNSEKGEVRAALQAASASVVQQAPEDADFVGGYRWAEAPLDRAPQTCRTHLNLSISLNRSSSLARPSVHLLLPQHQSYGNEASPFSRDACIVFSPLADVVIYLVGSGEYDELMRKCRPSPTSSPMSSTDFGITVPPWRSPQRPLTPPHNTSQ